MASSSALMSNRFSHFHLFYFLFIFSGTFIGYYLAILQPEIDFSKKKILVNENKIILTFFFSILFISLIAFPIDFYLLIQYGLASVLSISYYTQFTTQRGTFYGTRSIFLLKNLVLAFAWALVTSPFQDNSFASLILFSHRFLFIFALSVSIDLRDINKDLERNINTFPIKFGFNKTKFFAIILILLSSTLLYLYEALSHAESMRIAILSSGALSIVGILSLQQASKNEQYLIFIDGNLLLYGLLFFIFA